jgi:hypothetical protein
VSWLLWVPINHATLHHASNVGWVLADDALAAIFVGAVVSTALRMLPLSFFPGGELAAWHKGAWSATFGAALFVMLAVMLNPNSSSVKTGPSNWITAVVLLVLFAAASVSFALYYQRRDRHALRAPHAAGD